MDGCFPMSSAPCCKVKFVMFLTMLVAPEGRRIQQVNRNGDTLTSRGSFSSPGRAGSKSNVLDLNKRDSAQSPMDMFMNDPAFTKGDPPKLPMDMLMNDPAFKEQLVAMAGHMEAFAKKAPKTLLARAEKMANEMFKLSLDSSSSAQADSSLSQDMAAMMADPDFQKQAQEFAKIMQKNAKVDRDFQGDLEAAGAALSSQQTSAFFPEIATEEVNGPKFQEFSGRVSEALGFLKLYPEFLEKAKSLAAHVESVKDSQKPGTAEKVRKQVDAMIANTKFKAMPFVVVHTMSETENGLESVANDKFREELNSLAHKPTQELFAAMEAMGRTPEADARIALHATLWSPEVNEQKGLAPSGSKITPDQGLD